MTAARGPGGTRRGSYHHGDLRDALIDAALDILAQDDLAGLTLRACARRVGVSHAAPKHHFDDLAQLLAAVAARGFNELADALAVGRGAAGDDPHALFASVARTYVAFARRRPALFRLMFRSDLLAGDDPALRAATAAAFGEMTYCITQLRGEPAEPFDEIRTRFSEPGLRDDILLGWSAIHGYAQLLLEGQLAPFGGREPADAFVDDTLALASERLSGLLQER